MTNLINPNHVFDGLFSKARMPELDTSSQPDWDELAREALRQYMQNSGSIYNIDNPYNNFADRYEYKLVDVDDRHWEDVIFKFEYKLKDNQEGVETEEPRFEGSEFSKKVILYKTPQESLKEIPSNPELVYRGMSWEEWQEIRKNGYIQSHGGANLGEKQSGKTYFGKNPETALYYVRGFSPVMFEPSIKKPGIVIAIDKDGGIDGPNEKEGVSESEYAFTEPVSIRRIQNVWIIKPIKQSRIGEQDIKCQWVHEKYYDEEKGIDQYKRVGVDNCRGGSAFPPSYGYAIIEYQGKY